MKKLLLLCLFLLCFQGVGFAKDIPFQNGSTKEALSRINSLFDVSQPILVAPGLTVAMEHFITQNTIYSANKETAEKYFFYRSKSWYGDVTYYFKEIVGFELSFTNTSDKFYNINWSGSNITFGNFSGMPFVSGMKYIDAGNPNVTPDTLLPPNTITTLKIYTSNLEFTSGDWTFNGELIPVDNSMQLILYLKAISDNTPSYYTVKFSHIGIGNN